MISSVVSRRALFAVVSPVHAVRLNVRNLAGTAGPIVSGGGSFGRKEKAEEDRYFKALNEKQLKEFSEAVHKKELAGLLKVLPENHGLSPETLHAILVWKHKDFM